MAGYLGGRALRGLRTQSPILETIPDDLAAKIYGREPNDFEVLYHGTSSNRAGKIVGSQFFEPQGFKKFPTFFAEDYATSRYFAFEQMAKYNIPAETPPKSLTIIKFEIPKDIASHLGIDRASRRRIGEELDLPLPPIEGGSGNERILYDVDTFNNVLKSGQINTTRFKIKFQQ